MTVRRLAPAICLTLALAACGNAEAPSTTTPTDQLTGQTTDPPSESTAPATEEASPTTEAVAEGSGCSPESQTSLPDGRWFGRVVSAKDAAIEFDLACWFSGEAAFAAAAEDGGESNNDYYVRNQNSTTREVPVAEDAVVTYYQSGDPESGEEGDFETWRDVLAGQEMHLGIWIEIESGEVVSVEEQWVP